MLENPTPGDTLLNGAADDVFLRVAHAVSLPIDEHFFDRMTRRIVDALGVDSGLIALRDPANPDRVRSRTFILNGRPSSDIAYDIAGTPCWCIIQGEVGSTNKPSSNSFRTIQC